MRRFKILATLCTLLGLSFFFLQHQPEPAPIAPEAKTARTAASVVTRAEPPKLPKAIPAQNPPHQKEGPLSDFRASFGQDLHLEFSESGLLASVRGDLAHPPQGMHARAKGNFSTAEPQQAIARAREILAQAAPLMGMENGLPLQGAESHGDQYSARVSFQEFSNGLPIAPSGNVTVDLGPNGELLGMYSSYVPGISVAGNLNLSPEAAKNEAIRAIPDAGIALRARGGSTVIWVNNAVGRPAYVYTVQGRQVVVDGATGKILASRDQRVD